MKEKTRERKQADQEFGDCYTFTAIDADTKLMIAYQVGRRTPEDTTAFIRKLAQKVTGRFQLTTDGWTSYSISIPLTLGLRCQWAVVIKSYGNEQLSERRYSPATIVATACKSRLGNPDMDTASTSYIERSNLTIRMHVRRMTRLTNAFSKKRENHEHAMALFFAFYNFCRGHETLKGATPAMAAKLTDRAWSIRDLLEIMATQI